MASPPDSHRIEQELRDVAALADGSISPDRRDEIAARVADSATLTWTLERQRRVVSAIRAWDTPAPSALRARLEAERERAQARSRRRWRVGLALPALSGAVVVAIVLMLAGRSPDAPSVGQVADLGGRPAHDAPPRSPATHPAWLSRAGAALPFPNLEPKFGWRAVGAREDTVAGRDLTTVAYERNGLRIAYTIVSGTALASPADGQATSRGGITFHVVQHKGTAVITWLREGHTCVLTGSATSRADLLKLAAWTADRKIPVDAAPGSSSRFLQRRSLSRLGAETSRS